MIRALLRLFPYVRHLEEELASVRNELVSEKAVGAARDRYIDSLEGMKNHQARTIEELRKKLEWVLHRRRP